jgi:hypothetical protein
MNIPDPVSTGITVVALSQAAKQGQDFIAAACGHPGDSLGTILGKWTKQRFDNMHAIGHRASLIMLDLGLSARSDIPLKNMVPIVEAGSLEEDSELQKRWANLLANAVDPRRSDSINAVFPYILRDLGAREVRFINALYEMTLERQSGATWLKRASQVIYGGVDLMKLFYDLGFATVQIYVPNFENQQNPDYARDTDAYYLMMDLIRRHDVVRETVLPQDAHAGSYKPGERVHHFTELGTAFVEACRPPKP